MDDWTLYAVFGFLIFTATVVAPVVAHIDRRRKREAEKDDTPQD